MLLPTLLVSLLAFLVDILLFVPHLQWGGWIVLAATIILTTSGVVTCAMRRTLVSRKARKKRIAENAEMSGENFYNRQNAETLNPPPASDAELKEVAIPQPAPVAGAPAFATFESSTAVDDDKRPLNSRSPPPNDPNDSFWPPPNEPRGGPYGSVRGGGYRGRPPPRPMRNGPPDPHFMNPMNPNPDRNMGSRRGGMPGFPPRGRGPSMRGRGGPYAGGRGRGRPPGPPGPPGPGGPGGPGGYPPNVRGFPGDGPGPYGGRPPNGPRYGGPGIPRDGNGMRGPPPVNTYDQHMGQDIEMETSPINSHPPPNIPQGAPPPIRRIQSPTSIYSRPE